MHRQLSPQRSRRASSSALLLVATTVLLAAVLLATGASGQPAPGDFVSAPPGPIPLPPGAAGGAALPSAAPPGSSVITNDWSGAVRVLRVPGATGAGAAEARAAAEIFPDSHKVWMHVTGTDPRPIEAARRGARKWICSGGCELTLPDGPVDPAGSTTSIAVGNVATNPGDAMLRSIKAQLPLQPLPLTIWRPIETDNPTTRSSTISGATSTGQLMFDPVLLGRRSYRHVCAYPPVEKRATDGNEVPICRDGPRQKPENDSAELRLGFQWPRTSELADFEYLAITDTCGNARVQPFQRAFAVPVYHVASGGCGTADGRVLRVFPAGGWVRVTAFNLDTPAAGNVVSATFRITVPPLEDLVSANTPPMLFPDPLFEDLQIDCGPLLHKARSGPGGIPRGAPSKQLPGQTAPPGMSVPGQTPPPGKSLPGQTPPPGKAGPRETWGELDALDKAPGSPPAGVGEGDTDKNAGGKRADGQPTPPIVRKARIIPASAPSGQPMFHQGLVIGPEPLLRGNCRVEMRGQTKRRLVAPLALRIKITRTDVAPQVTLLDQPWIVTPNDSIFRIPPFDPNLFDGESRLRVEIYSDPLSPEGNVVLLSDAGRVARIENIALAESFKLQRLIGSVTVYSAPLCGESNFETVEGVGSCIRGYFTVPAMLATLQVTRAPWVERPLITRAILSAVGIAFAIDSYDPVEREAFPIALQLGGFVQDLGENRLGLLSYVGVAPTIPILGEGGNTTSIGLLGGVGMEYISRSDGPDEGFKPAAFLSIVVLVGQANPAAPTGGSHVGAYGAGVTPGATY